MRWKILANATSRHHGSFLSYLLTSGSAPQCFPACHSFPGSHANTGSRFVCFCTVAHSRNSQELYISKRLIKITHQNILRSSWRFDISRSWSWEHHCIFMSDQAFRPPKVKHTRRKWISCRFYIYFISFRVDHRTIKYMRKMLMHQLSNLSHIPLI